MNYNRFIILFLSMMIAAIGCSKPDNTNQQDSKPIQKLNVMVPNYINNTEKKQWLSLAEKFEELNPNIEVKISADDMLMETGKLTSMLQVGINVPDVMLINAGASRVQALVNINQIKPLNELYEKYNWKNQLRPFPLNSVSYGKKTLYELPYNIDSLQVYYNKDILAKHDLNVPTTFEAFIDTCAQLQEAGEVPITVGARDGFMVNWLFSNVLEAVSGGEAVEELILGEGKWNDPKIVQSAEVVSDWVKKEYISKDSITLSFADSKYSFYNKKSAFIFFGTYQISDFVEQELMDTIGVLTLPSVNPKIKTKPVSGVGLTWVIPTKTTNQALAEKWLNFVLSPDYYEVLFRDPGYSFVPAAKSALFVQPSGELLRDVIKEMESGLAYNPAQFVGPETRVAYFQGLQDLVAQKASPKEAMDRIQVAKERDLVTK